MQLGAYLVTAHIRLLHMMQMSDSFLLLLSVSFMIVAKILNTYYCTVATFMTYLIRSICGLYMHSCPHT